ncbi:MAG TPA: hypothetical protein VFP13_02415 [Actinomycetota bacterium]|nr:hypothetical protein [Actinomycetota bacterium]
MDTTNGSPTAGGAEVGGTAVPTTRRLQRHLLFGALICFALPFLTVTCYGESTVSGVQAATSIDITPKDDPGERELVAEESANGFAFLALVATAAAFAFAVRVTDRQPAVWAAVVGVIALQALYLYAFQRTTGSAFPRIGFVGALLLLAAGAWAGVGRIPRWVVGALCGLAVLMLPGALIPVGDVYEAGAIFLPVMLGGFAAVTVAVGAIPAAGRQIEPASPPTALRVVIAGIVGIVILAASIVAAVVLLGMGSSGDPAEASGAAYVVAIVAAAANVAGGLGAWAAGRAITRPRARRAIPSAALGAGA